jgi:hypothetical protein
MNAPTDTRSQQPRVVLDKDEAREGVTGHNVRYVLGFSLAGVVAVFVLLYIFYFAV